jgi:hypothetical protein
MAAGTPEEGTPKKQGSKMESGEREDREESEEHMGGVAKVRKYEEDQQGPTVEGVQRVDGGATVQEGKHPIPVEIRTYTAARSPIQNIPSGLAELRTMWGRGGDHPSLLVDVPVVCRSEAAKMVGGGRRMHSPQVREGIGW